MYIILVVGVIQIIVIMNEYREFLTVSVSHVQRRPTKFNAADSLVMVHV